MSSQSWSRRYWSSFSFVGLVCAVSFFAASLSPSLLPRIYIVQGLLSGIALAVGYCVGVFFVWLWQYLELPVPRGTTQKFGKWLSTIGAALLALAFLWRATVWQNSIRSLMEMEPVPTAYPWRVALIAVLFGAALIAAARTIASGCRLVNHRLSLVLPPKIAQLLSVVVVAALLIFMINGVLARAALRVADETFLQIDRVVDEEISPPKNPLAAGSATSLVAWGTIGRKGKEFIVDGPTQEQLSQFAGRQALRPLRVYIGLRSADTPQQRAQLALDELKRVGGFDRSILVVATPTGTGWLDPGAVDTLEFLYAGDTAIVSMQYSYLPSWITIVVDPKRSCEAALTLFDEIYEYWQTLPADKRPKLCLHGLSLGSLGSEQCADLFSLFEDPIQGAVWSGPPFPSTKWSDLTADRNPDSPQWLPKFRDGTMVRFTARENAIDEFGERWGSMRFVYIQHASDPMTFFAPSLFYRKPVWLIGQRGPDVSPYLSWYPIVTFLQIACDLPMATSVPSGYGHNISPASYIDAWVAVSEPADWMAEDIRRLKETFAN